MVTKERIKELMEQEKTVYFVDRTYGPTQSQIVSVNLVFCCLYDNDSKLIVKNEDSETIWRIDLNKIFEAEKDAIHSLKYQQIDKRITLNLPTYETFLKQNRTNKFYCDSDECFYYLKASYMIEGVKIKLLSLYGEDAFLEKEWTLTEENYELACEECKKRFLMEGEL